MQEQDKSGLRTSSRVVAVICDLYAVAGVAACVGCMRRGRGSRPWGQAAESLLWRAAQLMCAVVGASVIYTQHCVALLGLCLDQGCEGHAWPEIREDSGRPAHAHLPSCIGFELVQSVAET